MVYASGCYVFFGQAKLLFTSSSSVVATRKIETSDPKEIDAAYLIDRLGLNEAEPEVSEGGGNVKQRIGEWEQREEKKPFAKPKGPARRR
jgi:twinfilin